MLTKAKPHSKPDFNLGDVNPYDYGGYFVWKDCRAVYFPESQSDTLTAYRFDISENGLTDLSWIKETEYQAIAEFIGVTATEITRLATSKDVAERAQFYRAVGDYFGWINLDSYPLQMDRKAFAKLYPLGKRK